MTSSSHEVSMGFEFDMCKLKLGSGGSGMVFLAQHRRTGDLVAVKRLFARGATAESAQSTPERLNCLHPSAHRITTLTPERNSVTDAEENMKRRHRRRCSSGRCSSRSISSSSSSSNRRNRCSTDHRETAEEEDSYDDEEEEEDEENQDGKGKVPSLFTQTLVAPFSTHLSSESTILQYLSPHPHIVKFLGSYTNSNRTTFFAMELMDSDLGRELRAANTAFMNEGVTRPLLHSVISAIAHLHKRGVAHRDIKPSNILLKCVDMTKAVGGIGGRFIATSTTETGCNGSAGDSKGADHNLHTSCFSGVEQCVKAVLGDFSAAHFIRESESVSSRRGTLYYKSPEQLMGRVENYFACDMWALGCTLFELSTGSIAFSGSTDLQVLHQICAKLGTDFICFPRKMGETTLFESLSAPSAMFLNLLQGLLALDPRERLTAEDALKHAFFDPIREEYGEENLSTEVTFSLNSRRFSHVDATQLVFRPITNMSTKRFRVAGTDSVLRTKIGANHSDVNLSRSGQRCGMWSSSVSGTSTPNMYFSCARSHGERSGRRCHRSCLSGLLGNCTATRHLSMSSSAQVAGAASMQGNDENLKSFEHVISPVPLRFSPLTSVKRHGGGGSAPGCGGSLLRFTPSANATIGNMQTSIQFEGPLPPPGHTAGPRMVEDDASVHRHDMDSPSVRKILFGSPQKSILSCLNDSFDKGEVAKATVEHNSTSHLQGSSWHLQKAVKSPKMFFSTSAAGGRETSIPLLELSSTLPSNGSMHSPNESGNTRSLPKDGDGDVKWADEHEEKVGGIKLIDTNLISQKVVYGKNSLTER